MARKFLIGPDRHGTVSEVIVSPSGCIVLVSGPKLAGDCLAMCSRDELLTFSEKLVADPAACPSVVAMYREVIAYLCVPTANG